MTEKKITIKDIARNCGVGLGTASRAINGQPGVRAEIRRKVLQYIEEIGWRSNNIKERLSIRDTGKSAIFISSPALLDHESDNSVPAAIREGLRKHGFDTVFLLGSSAELLQRVFSLKPACVIVLGMVNFIAPHIRDLLEHGIRVVGIGETDVFEGPILHPDHWQAGYDAARLLRKNGHRHIGFFGGLGVLKSLKSIDEVHTMRIRALLTGIQDACQEFDLAKDVISDCFDDSAQLRKALKAGRHTAWLCTQERMCRILLYEAAQLGLRIPEDISLITLSSALPRYAFPLDVTRFEMDTPSRAAKAVELLLSGDMTTKEYKFKFNYHPGATVRKLKGER